MNKEERFYIDELQSIRGFCLHSDKEDVYKYIYSLQQENKLLKEKVNKLETNIDEVIRELEEFEDCSILEEDRKRMIAILKRS